MIRSSCHRRRWCHSLLIITTLAFMFFLTACAPKMVTKGDKFPTIYEELPTSILILPPINESTAADAKEYYATTIQEPLSFLGYYVFPYEITTEILKMEGIYDAELMKDLPLQKFREYFGTDAVLFTTIKKWNLAYMVLAANLTISIDCELKSTKSNATLWQYNGTVVVDLSGGDTGGSIVGLIAKAIITAALQIIWPSVLCLTGNITPSMGKIASNSSENKPNLNSRFLIFLCHIGGIRMFHLRFCVIDNRGAHIFRNTSL
jgi:hypothetical protein